ncbi:TIGR03089 family protein [Mangrovactinospora gilvigrisea]|uniref:TIGR03089 family protein n=1 Tax=Mangrovactinospora gilvigrisea TaxID=1428644 RepID=A0A1J7BYR8_9ACTN|nr:TIGR03089 family protein [Mangrovactinospora gilvigrisea]OIV38625.1 TIGR03089 family protein [Mangrovactinospora gilvigrisea]
MTTSSADTPDALLRAALAADPARPLVTFYDDATGERVELSAATFANWVAKTANLLQEELAVEAGGRVALLLPLHWQTAVWLHACWAVGAVAAPDGDAAAAEVAVSGPEAAALAAARECRGERVALALRPLGGRFPQVPEGFLDYAAEVPGQGDAFFPYQQVGAGDAALAPAGGGAAVLTGAQVVARARERAAELGLAAGARVLVADTAGVDLVDALLVPLAVGGSVVLVRNAAQGPAGGAAKRAEAERVTDTLG